MSDKKKDRLKFTLKFGAILNLISLIVFIPLQVLFIPFAVLGAIYVAYCQLGVSKKLGISQTAIEVLNGRWTMHIFGIRTDKTCDRLIKVLPNTSAIGLWLVLAPLWVKFKISGELFMYPRVPVQGDVTHGRESARPARRRPRRRSPPRFR